MLGWDGRGSLETWNHSTPTTVGDTRMIETGSLGVKITRGTKGSFTLLSGVTVKCRTDIGIYFNVLTQIPAPQAGWVALKGCA